MKKFISNSLLLCAFLLTFFSAIEIALYYRTNPYSYKHRYVMSHLDDIQVLLMGNSHIYDGLIPDSMGRHIFNTATSGRPYVFDAELVNQYLPLIKKIQTIIMPLDYFSFYLGREKTNPRYLHTKNDMLNMHKCMHYKYMNVPADFWYWSELLYSETNFISRFIDRPEKSRDCDSLGFQRLKLSNRKPGWNVKALPLLIDTTIPINQVEYAFLYKQYKNLANATNNKHVRLVLVGTPLYKTYQEDINKDVVNEIYDFVKKLEKEFPNVEYYDFTFDHRFNDDDFFDTSHLSENGAIKYSRLMKDVIFNKPSERFVVYR